MKLRSGAFLELELDRTGYTLGSKDPTVEGPLVENTKLSLSQSGASSEVDTLREYAELAGGTFKSFAE